MFKDTFFRDCIFPVNVRETRIRVCVEAAEEWLIDKYPSIRDKFVWEYPGDSLLIRANLKHKSGQNLI